MATVIAWLVMLFVGLPLVLGFIIILGDSTQGGTLGPRQWTRARTIRGFRDGLVGIVFITLVITVMCAVVALLGWAGATIAA